MYLVGCQNVYYILCWATILLTLRTSGVEYRSESILLQMLEKSHRGEKYVCMDTEMRLVKRCEGAGTAGAWQLSNSCHLGFYGGSKKKWAAEIRKSSRPRNCCILCLPGRRAVEYLLLLLSRSYFISLSLSFSLSLSLSLFHTHSHTHLYMYTHTLTDTHTHTHTHTHLHSHWHTHMHTHIHKNTFFSLYLFHKHSCGQFRQHYMR